MYKKKVAWLVLTALMISLVPKPITYGAEADNTSAYEERFMEMWEDLHDSDNGYFSEQGIPYHSVETMIVEAPDYGHVTTSEAFSYYLWLEAMYGKFSGDFSSFEDAWDITEKYIIPGDKDQPNSSMSKYNANSPATYAAEWEEPDLYPSAMDFGAAVGKDPINSDLTSTYGTSQIYGMHWLLDVDNWYGFGQRGDGTSTPSYINTYQRGTQESVFETIPQPGYETMKFGGKNGFLDLFVKDNSYSQQFKYTNAPDADARAVQATYWANEWAKDYGVDLSDDVSKATKMGDYLRYSMFDKYFRKIGNSSTAGTGYDSSHYLLSWYYAWGGGTTADWAWKIGCSHNHFGYQNPMTAWILSEDSEFKPASQNGATDWGESLDRQLEFYQWLQSSEGAIAGGASNSYNGRYETLPSNVSTFYGMGYEENPVYSDPGSNTWFGMQTWSMQRVAEYYYQTGDTRAKDIMDKWVSWVKTVVKLNSDGTFQIPGKIAWTGQPDTWTGTYTGNSGLHVSVETYGTDLGIVGSLANTLLYYSKASGDDESRVLAKELLDRTWTLYRDEKGVSCTEYIDPTRYFEQEVYVPEGFTGTMPNGDEIKNGIKFLDIRSKYKDDPNYENLLNAYNTGTDMEINYHRFWAQCDVAIANGLYSILFGEETNESNSTLSTNKATFDKNAAEDISVEVTLNGNTLDAINNGKDALVKGTDYTVNDNVVTISKDYLAKYSVGNVNLTFDFSAGKNSALKVSVIDSSVPEAVEGDIKVQMYNASTSNTTNGISPKFKIYNEGDSDISLSDVKLRYYYTIDGDKDQSFWCDWSTVGSNNVTGTFVKMDASKTGADHYLEIGFSNGAGTLAAGQSLEVQVRFSKSDWSNYTQDGDYSFSTANTSYADSEKVTGYING
ncbi:exoglucanase, partial [Lachnotalea glycerini]